MLIVCGIVGSNVTGVVVLAKVPIWETCPRALPEAEIRAPIEESPMTSDVEVFAIVTRVDEPIFSLWVFVLQSNCGSKKRNLEELEERGYLLQGLWNKQLPRLTNAAPPLT